MPPAGSISFFSAYLAGDPRQGRRPSRRGLAVPLVDAVAGVAVLSLATLARPRLLARARSIEAKLSRQTQRKRPLRALPLRGRGALVRLPIDRARRLPRRPRARRARSASPLRPTTLSNVFKTKKSRMVPFLSSVAPRSHGRRSAALVGVLIGVHSPARARSRVGGSRASSLHIRPVVYQADIDLIQCMRCISGCIRALSASYNCIRAKLIYH